MQTVKKSFFFDWLTYVDIRKVKYRVASRMLYVSQYYGCGSVSRGSNGLGVTLTTHCHLAPRLTKD